MNFTTNETYFDGHELPSDSEVLREAETLSAEILKDVELSRQSLGVVVLKTLRLARILNDFEMQQLFEFESSGYPVGPTGVTPEVWLAGTQAGRRFFQTNPQTNTQQEYIYTESIEFMEQTIAMGHTSLEVAHDPDVSVSSANEAQFVHVPAGNAIERQQLRSQMHDAIGKLASRRSFIYDYAARKHYEVKFSGFADDVFGRIRANVDASIGITVPGAVRKFTAVHDNLRSDNPEDWANAVHSCRRILQELADALFPPQSETRTRHIDGKTIEISLGNENYINRLIAFIEDASESKRFREIVGSHLKYIGERLDALFGAAQKGSHATVTKEEADRCVVYSYLLVGDILSLRQFEPQTADISDSNAPSNISNVDFHPLKS